MFRSRQVMLGLATALILVACQSTTSQTPLPSVSTSASSGASTTPTEEPTPYPRETVRIQLAAGFTGVLPLYIAGDAGFFDEYGIEPEYINSNEATRLLLSGDADVGTPSPVVASVAVVQGQPLQIVCSVQNKLTQSLVVRSDVAETIDAEPGDWEAVLQGLQGKSIGVTVAGGSPDLNLRYMLIEAGMDPESDVTIVATGSGGNQVAAIEGNQVDAILTFTPITQNLVAGGTGVDMINLASGDGPPALQQPFVVAAVTPEWLEENPELGHRFVNAMVDTMEWIVDPANGDELKDIVTTRLEGIDPDIADQVIEEMIATMDPSFPEESLDNVNAVLQANGLASTPVTADQIIAADFVP